MDTEVVALSHKAMLDGFLSFDEVVAIDLDCNAKLQVHSVALQNLLGYIDIELQGKEILEYVAEQDQHRFRRALKQGVKTHKAISLVDYFGRQVRCKAFFIPRDGACWSVIFIDQTHEYLQLQRAKYTQNHDVLTDLGTHRALDFQLQQLAATHCECAQISLLVLEIRYFSLINSTHGCEIGDQLLQHVGEQIKRCANAHSRLLGFRTAGAEFMLLYAAKTGEQEVFQGIDKIAQNLLSACSGNVKLGDHLLDVSADVAVIKVEPPMEGDYIEQARQALQKGADNQPVATAL